jgi:plasmid stabilization system protein ParE
VIYTLVIRPEAADDLIAARDWYQAQRNGLGREFLDAVEETFARIQDNPERRAPEYKSVRRARTMRFPYIVYYRIIADVVEILAVQHGSRNVRRRQAPT